MKLREDQRISIHGVLEDLAFFGEIIEAYQLLDVVFVHCLKTKRFYYFKGVFLGFALAGYLDDVERSQVRSLIDEILDI